MTPWCVERRPLGQASQCRCLGEGKPVHALAKQVSAMNLDPIGTIPEINHVQIRLKDLLLGQRPLQSPGELDLDQLSTEASFVGQVRQKCVPYHLHGDGAESLPYADGRQVTQERSAGASPVDSVVVIEASILGSDECRTH